MSLNSSILAKEIARAPSALLRTAGLAMMLSAKWYAFLFVVGVSLLICGPICFESAAPLFTTVAGILIGWALACAVVQHATARAREVMTKAEDVAADLNVTSDEKSGPLPAQLATGLPILDEVLSGTRRVGFHLLETVGALGRELQNLIERYELLSTNIAASVVIRNADGQILFCSPYTEVLTGYSLDYIEHYEGDFFSDIVLPEDRERYQRAIGISLVGEDIVVRYQIKHQSGITLWIETHLVPVLSGDGESVSVMGVSIDVTSTIRYQQKIEEHNRDLNDFTYMVSHDLKAPIFTIKGMASLLIEDYGESLDSDARESIAHIIEAASRLDLLVRSVIEYSSLSTKEIEEDEIELTQIFTELLNDLGGIIKESNASIVIPRKLPRVLGEHVRIYQVFSNLLGNALKYRSPLREPQIIVSLTEGVGELITIDIADNGLGIPNNKLADIFRPYHRAHGNIVEGSGIGLACVKKILDRLGGFVSVKSVEGEGSIFSVTLRSAKVTNRDLSTTKHNEAPARAVD